VIGKSFQDNDILAYRLGSAPGSGERKSKVLFTGLHHARELITANMVVKIFLETLHSLVHNTSRFTFWNFCDVLIVPVVNIDSHKLISQSFGTPDFDLHKDKRKNMNSGVCADGSVVEQGVDLNRNYGFHYGEDVGDNDECGETFRGRNAFSEPETQAIRDFLKGEDRLVSAMNFHSYGNMWIHPFNYMKVANQFPENTARAVVNFYHDFGKEVTRISESLYGNAIQMVNYSTDGEASDWMLGELGVISFSPELGSINPDAQDFKIPQRLVSPVIWENFKVIELFLHKNSFELRNFSYGFDNHGDFEVFLENGGLATVFDPVLSIPRTQRSASFVSQLSKVQVEDRPGEVQEALIQYTDEELLISFPQIHRLEKLRLSFSFTGKSIMRHGFAVECRLKTASGFTFGELEWSHGGAAAHPRKVSQFMFGVGLGGAGFFAIFVLLKFFSWLHGKRTVSVEGAAQELNC
jgi:hypothetical protein